MEKWEAGEELAAVAGRIIDGNCLGKKIKIHV